MLVRHAPGVVALLALCILPGCLRIQREYPEKQQFVLETARPAGERASVSKGVLQVNEFRVVEPYQGRGLKYRRGEFRLESDFYNEFFSLPGQMISEEVRKWLDGSGLFEMVVSRPGQILPTHFLDGTVEAIYGDYRSSPPRAVLELEFILTREERGKAKVVLKRRYNEEQPAPGPSPGDLVRAWNDGLGRIVQQFETELGKVLAAP